MARRRRGAEMKWLRSIWPSSARVAAGAVVGLSVAALLYIATVSVPDDSICDTSAADGHPELCGTTTRICTDGVETEQRQALVIIAAGSERAASTWLYNALRILMRIRDPNTVYGWHVDLHALYDAYGLPNGRVANVSVASKQFASRAEAYRSLGSVLIKLHLVQDWHEFNGGGEADTRMEPYVDGVFTTHRDVREVVRSVRDMGWGVKVDRAKLAQDDFCKKRRVKQEVTFLKSGQYKKESTWVNLAQAHLKCRQALLHSAGRKLKMDIKAERVRGLSLDGTVELLAQMGRHLDYGYSDAELQLAARELRALRPPPCNGGFAFEMDVNPVTHFHKGHVRFVKSSAAEAVDRRGMRAIARDPQCAAWLRRHGYLS